MTIDDIKSKILAVLGDYPVKKVVLFGSRALGTNRDDSDVDLIVEFTEPVSLLILSEMRIRLAEVLDLNVDLIHGPIREEDMLDIDKTVELYVA